MNLECKEIPNGFFVELAYKNQKTTTKVQISEKVGEKVGENLTENQKKILELILKDNRLSAHDLSIRVGISQRKTEENIQKLRIAGILVRIGAAKGGHWEIIK